MHAYRRLTLKDAIICTAKIYVLLWTISEIWFCCSPYRITELCHSKSNRLFVLRFAHEKNSSVRFEIIGSRYPN